MYAVVKSWSFLEYSRYQRLETLKNTGKIQGELNSTCIVKLERAQGASGSKQDNNVLLA